MKDIKVFEAAGDFTNPRYTELFFTHFYPKHVLRFLLDQWPNLVNRAFVTLNHDLYVTLQGPSKFGVAGDAKLKTSKISYQISPFHPYPKVVRMTPWIQNTWIVIFKLPNRPQSLRLKS
ncbi:MAG: hypothetical protein JJU13_01260 [Balneolaceae bacterium]|nr:hypothetical protein [Balneolaceae bacterium]